MNCFEAQDNLSSILGQLHESSAFTDTVALRFGWSLVLALTFALACATCPNNSKKQIFTIITSSKLCADLLVFTRHRHDMLLLEPTCGSTCLFRHESVSTSCVVVICLQRDFQTVVRKHLLHSPQPNFQTQAQNQALPHLDLVQPMAIGLHLPCALVGLSFWLCLLPKSSKSFPRTNRRNKDTRLFFNPLLRSSWHCECTSRYHNQKPTLSK